MSGGPRGHGLVTVLGTRKFMTDFADMLTAWNTWAAETVAGWPEDLTSADPDRHVFDAIASRPVEPVTPPHGSP